MPVDYATVTAEGHAGQEARSRGVDDAPRLGRDVPPYILGELVRRS